MGGNIIPQDGDSLGGWWRWVQEGEGRGREALLGIWLLKQVDGFGRQNPRLVWRLGWRLNPKFETWHGTLLGWAFVADIPPPVGWTGGQGTYLTCVLGGCAASSPPGRARLPWAGFGFCNPPLCVCAGWFSLLGPSQGWLDVAVDTTSPFLTILELLLLAFSARLFVFSLASPVVCCA